MNTYATKCIHGRRITGPCHRCATARTEAPTDLTLPESARLVGVSAVYSVTLPVVIVPGESVWRVMEEVTMGLPVEWAEQPATGDSAGHRQFKISATHIMDLHQIIDNYGGHQSAYHDEIESL